MSGEANDGYKKICQSTVDQKTAVACFKKGTDEIVGISITALFSQGNSKEDQILELVTNISKQCKSVLRPK